MPPTTRNQLLVLSLGLMGVTLGGPLACVPEEEAGLVGPDEAETTPRTSGKVSGKVTGNASPAPSASPSATPASGGGSAGNSGVTIGAGISDDPPPATSLPTLPPVTVPDPTPTPFGTAGQEVGFQGEGLALTGLGALPFPLVLTTTGAQEIAASGYAGTRFGAPIAGPVAIAADPAAGSRSAWIASSTPAHLDRLTMGTGGFGFDGSVTLPATPSALAASGDEVWAPLVDGRLVRVRTTDLTTAAFTGPARPVAIALGTSRAWIVTRDRVLAEIDRTTGTLVATSSTGPDPVDVAVDAAGTVWVACAGDDTVSRHTASVSQTLSVGPAPRALLADGRRLWVAVTGGMATLTPAGERESPDVSLRFSPVDLARDATGRIWALGSAGQIQWVWPRKAGE
jgi:hypothetical protein